MCILAWMIRNSLATSCCALPRAEGLFSSEKGLARQLHLVQQFFNMPVPMLGHNEYESLAPVTGRGNAGRLTWRYSAINVYPVFRFLEGLRDLSVSSFKN